MNYSERGSDNELSRRIYGRNDSDPEGCNLQSASTFSGAKAVTEAYSKMRTGTDSNCACKLL